MVVYVASPLVGSHGSAASPLVGSHGRAASPLVGSCWDRLGSVHLHITMQHCVEH